MTHHRKYGRGLARPSPMPIETLRALLAYDRDTGRLVWKACPLGGQGARRMRPGSIAGCLNHYGYIVVRIAKVLYPAHRIIWYLETGVWPPEQVDHINEAKADNRWDNLRLASHAENMKYMHTHRIEREGPKPVPQVSYIEETYKADATLADDVKQFLSYDPTTGMLTWLEDRGCNFNRRKAGSVAGSIKDNGYVAVKINRQFFKAHRLAWVLMTGEWPPGEIDHINGNRADNRWSNLRLVTRGQNQHNRGSGKTSKSGYRGVSRNGNGFKAQISINGKLLHFPTRPTAEEAYADYCKAAVEHHGQYARLS